MFVEGTTEQVFADTVLKPHLANHGVYLHSPVLVAHAKRKGRIHRGGGRRFRPMQNDIERRLKEDASEDVRFTTMVDLYALYSDFPGRDRADKLRSKPYERVVALEEAWQEETVDRRFIPFIQLHEFEAYLFVDVARFPSSVTVRAAELLSCRESPITWALRSSSTMGNILPPPRG